MRIAFYAPLKSPSHSTPSGDRRVARLLRDALELAGHSVEVASDFRSFEGRGDVSVQASLRRQGGQIADCLRDRWLHGPRDERPDLWVTYHLYYKAPDWLGPPVCASLDIPYVVVEASSAAKRSTGLWAMGHATVCDAIRRAQLLLCPTADDVPALELIALPTTVIRRLPPFLDPAPYRRAAASRHTHRLQLAKLHGLDPAMLWIIVAAMMRPGDKLSSFQVLAQVLGRLRDLPWQLLVAGDGLAGNAVRAMLQDVAPGRCRFAGECGADPLAAMYAASDICVWPAVNEAYGMAMLEAQAAGTPVVSCAVRGVPDVVVDGVTGLLAPADDVQALSECLRALLLDPVRRTEMGTNAAHFVAGERSIAQAAIILQTVLAPLVTGAVLSPATKALA